MLVPHNSLLNNFYLLNMETHEVEDVFYTQSELYREFNLNISILNGRIEYIKDQPLGFLMFQVSGKNAEIERLKNHIDQSNGIERVAYIG